MSARKISPRNDPRRNDMGISPGRLNIINEKRQYTKEDLQTFKLVKASRENGITSHTHVVEFGRPLTEAERDLFQSVLIGFITPSAFRINLMVILWRSRRLSF